MADVALKTEPSDLLVRRPREGEEGGVGRGEEPRGAPEPRVR